MIHADEVLGAAKQLGAGHANITVGGDLNIRKSPAADPEVIGTVNVVRGFPVPGRADSRATATCPAARSVALASAPVALASPAEVSRYRCRRGRPGVGSSCQHASTRPRSASRIKIGYSVPDFRPVCLASA